MKKFFMPSEEELYRMQEIGVNVYKYLLVKAIESLAVEGVNIPNKGIFKSSYKYLKENPIIATSICKMFPSETLYSEYAQNDINLCLSLIKERKDDSIYSLDNLSLFENGALTLDNLYITSTTVNTLADKLPMCPEYRFKYKDNKLLDDIFSRRFDDYLLHEAKDKLSLIEPAYLLIEGETIKDSEKLKYSVEAYANRYNIPVWAGEEYAKEDIILKPDNNVKRLVRCINQNKDNLY